MADRLRVVERNGARRPVVLLDLQDGVGYKLTRDTFAFTPPAEKVRMVAGGNRFAGSRPVGATHDNAQVAATWLVKGATVDEAMRKADVLVAQAENALGAPRRYIEWKSELATYPTYFERRGPATWTPTYRWVQMTQARSWEFQITWPVAPLPEWDPMDVYDDFAVDSLADYVADAGTGLLVAGGALSPGDTTEKRLTHAIRGYSYEDVQVTAKVNTGPTVTAMHFFARVKKLDNSNWIEGGFQAGGGGLGIWKYDGGVRTQLDAGVALTPATSTAYWVRTRVEGNVVTASVFTSVPTPTATPAFTTTHTLAGANATKFGAGVAGKVGLRWVPPGTSQTVDDFAVEPFTYRNRTLPEAIVLGGDIPGSAPALADIEVTETAASNVAPFALFAWNRNPVGARGVMYPFGVIDSAAMDVSDFTTTADANARGGTLLTFDTAADNMKVSSVHVTYAEIGLDPFTEGDVDMEVWARVRIASTVLAPRLTLYQWPYMTNVPPVYVTEWGTDGKLLPVPSSGDRYRFVRLGILPVHGPVGDDLVLWPQLSCAAGSSGLLGLDYLLLVPAKRRAASPTGKPYDATYPRFLVTTTDQTRIIASSLEGYAQHATLSHAGAHRGPGLGGSPIELLPSIYPARTDLLVKLSSLVPDDPTLDATTEDLSQTATVHVAVTPRSFVPRG